MELLNALVTTERDLLKLAEQHPSLKSDPRLREKFDRALDGVMDLYSVALVTEVKKEITEISSMTV